MHALALIVLITAACGRVGFAVHDGTDGGGDDGATIDACEAADWSSTITPLANLSVDGAEDWEPAVSPQGTTIVFASYRAGVGDSQLFVATRASPDDDFGPPEVIAGFGAVAGDTVFGPAWSIDGSILYFSNDSGSHEADYLGGTSFGPSRSSELPGFSVVFAGPDDVYATNQFVIDDYDLEHWTRVGAQWVEQPLPAAYRRSGMYENDGWPGFDRGRRQLYFEHEVNTEAFIVRVQLDQSGAVPATFDAQELAFLGNDLGDPDLSPDGLRMYVSSRRREGTDNDIYMFERACR
ncbi:MAG: TolB family protein [Kofleriaceae bacterium]